MKKLFLILIAFAVIFNSCKKNSSSDPVSPVPPVPPVNSTGNILNTNAHIVDTLAISGVTATSVSISKSVTTYRPVVGDIILVRPCLQSQYGMLSKVTGVSETAGQVICTIVPSNLNEAFKQLNINYTQVDTSSAFAFYRTGPSFDLSFSNTVFNAIKINGNLHINIPVTIIEYVKKAGSLKPEKVIIRADFNTEGSSIEISNTNDGAEVIPGQTKVFSYPPHPIIILVPIGPILFPIEFTQRIVVNMFSLDFSGKASWTTIPKISATVGCKYENGMWTNLSTYSIDASASDLIKANFSPSGSFTASGTIIKPRYEISPYGLDLMKAFFEIPATIELTGQHATPNYSLKFKLDVKGGVETEFWDGLKQEYAISGNVIDKTLLEGNWPKLILSTTAPASITQTSAVSGGNITDDGGSAITSRGVCWNTSINPTVYNTKTSDGTGIGVFNSSLTGLIPNKIYYVRAYAINSTDTAYGNEVNFTTAAPILATVTTVSASAITSATATAGGNITNDGGANITSRGVCWSISANPTIANSKTVDGAGTGSFTSSLTGLSAGTTYHARAYATNSAGTAYGNEVSFTTIAATLATINTTGISAITSTTASSGGTISNDGGVPVTSRGVCWSTGANPTIANSKTIDGAGTGSFSSFLTGLTEYTTYHIRAYATNNVGTAYGNEFIITTTSAVEQVIIGAHTWMVKNLDVSTYRNGDPIPQVTDPTQWANMTTGAWCYYNNDPANGAIYGKLYNWYAVMDPRGLAPAGWHISTSDEWFYTRDFLGGDVIAGGKMKSIGTSFWQSPNTGATNSTGFTGLPGGYRLSNAGNPGTFAGIGQFVPFWATGFGSGASFSLSYNSSILNFGTITPNSGLYVRCIRE